MSEEFKNNENEYNYTPPTEANYSSAENNIDPQPQRTEQPQYPYNTGYYSSGSQYNPTNTVYSYPQINHTQPGYDSPKKKEKKEKKRNGFGIILCCILLSLICGFAGAFGGLAIYNSYFSDPVDTNGNNIGGGNTVIYEKTEQDIPTDVKESGSVAVVAEIALPSVVEITTEAVVNNSFYGQYVTEGAGSGVIISADGYIATNNHVVAGASNVKVRLSNGDEYVAKIIGTDSQTDIAVIKIDAQNLVPAVYGDSSKLVIGELTVAIGNPLGELGGTVTDGIVSALDREITVDGEKMVLLQTSAAVNPGNSGGGLFNGKGELIGIVNAKSSGDSIEGLGFAIPINTAKPIIQDLIEKGHVTGRPSIGITIVEITSDYQRYMYGVSDYGVYIQKALSDELEAGDRIIAIDGNSISTSSDIKGILNGHKVGDEITITVSRKGKIVDVKITLIDSANNNLSVD